MAASLSTDVCTTWRAQFRRNCILYFVWCAVPLTPINKLPLGYECLSETRILKFMRSLHSTVFKPSIYMAPSACIHVYSIYLLYSFEFNCNKAAIHPMLYVCNYRIWCNLLWKPMKEWITHEVHVYIFCLKVRFIGTTLTGKTTV